MSGKVSRYSLARFPSGPVMLEMENGAYVRYHDFADARSRAESAEAELARVVDRCAAAEARAEANAKDAGRYRWLRTNCGKSINFSSAPCADVTVLMKIDDAGRHIAHCGPEQRVGIPSIDWAIDAAMAREGAE